MAIPFFQKHDITLAGAGTFFHQTYLAAQREQPGTPLFPAIRAFSGGGAPKPPQLHYDMAKEMGGVGIVAGYGLTEAPILTMCSDPRSDRQAGQHRGPTQPRC